MIDTAHMLNRFAAQADRTMERVDECVKAVWHVFRAAADVCCRKLQSFETALEMLEARLERCAAPLSAGRASKR